MAEQMDEERIKELQEKIKSMSPEELKEFQKQQCIFCHIISGKVQSRKIFEDDKSLAVLDINPANPGHVLLMPKEHYAIMPQIPEDEIGHLFMAAKALSNAMLRSLEVQGTNIIVANGVAAGQRAQHFMIHVIPRKDKDGVNFELPQKAMTEEQMDGIAEKIAMHLGGTFEREPRGKKEVIADFREKAGDKDFSKERTIERKDGTTEKKDWKGPQPKKTSEKDYNKKNREEGKGIPKDKAEEKSESEKNAGNEGGGIDLDDIARVLGAKK
ncbi:HIT domain-containing protein [Candidatus Woesearchaeota archaeon]|nr:HIT domain-containing protein [Candidatus Woesearchaeota archaeon]